MKSRFRLGSSGAHARAHAPQPATRSPRTRHPHCAPREALVRPCLGSWAARRLDTAERPRTPTHTPMPRHTNHLPSHPHPCTPRQTNHLGHFLLVHLLLPALAAAPSGRVVLVSSELHKSAPEVRCAGGIKSAVRSRGKYERGERVRVRVQAAEGRARGARPAADLAAAVAVQTTGFSLEWGMRRGLLGGCCVRPRARTRLGVRRPESPCRPGRAPSRLPACGQLRAGPCHGLASHTRAHRGRPACWLTSSRPFIVSPSPTPSLAAALPRVAHQAERPRRTGGALVTLTSRSAQAADSACRGISSRLEPLLDTPKSACAPGYAFSGRLAALQSLPLAHSLPVEQASPSAAAAAAETSEAQPASAASTEAGSAGAGGSGQGVGSSPAAAPSPCPPPVCPFNGMGLYKLRWLTAHTPCNS
jgi:hypothetical protein